MLETFFTQLLFLLIIVNPVSQVMLIVSIAADHPDRDVSRLILQGNLWAWVITSVVAVTGVFLFNVIFHVDLATLRLAGGLILAGNGYYRLSQGRTFHMQPSEHLDDLRVVPFAVPMIVGPATFSQAVTIAATHGELMVLSIVTAALGINIGMMFLALLAKRHLNHNVVNVSIRLSGLVTMTIGLQMIYNAAVELWRMAVSAV